MAQPCAYVVLSKELLSKFHLEQRMNKQKKESGRAICWSRVAADRRSVYEETGAACRCPITAEPPEIGKQKKSWTKPRSMNGFTA